MTTDNIHVVQRIYQAFGRADVATILDCLADDVEWDTWDAPSDLRASIPWLTPLHGRAEVPRFFATLTAALEITDFQVRDLLSSANQVSAEVAFDARHRSTGSVARIEEMHLWTFDEAGRVCRYRDYFDTAKDVEVLMPVAG